MTDKSILQEPDEGLSIERPPVRAGPTIPVENFATVASIYGGYVDAIKRGEIIQQIEIPPIDIDKDDVIVLTESFGTLQRIQAKQYIKMTDIAVEGIAGSGLYAFIDWLDLWSKINPWFVVPLGRMLNNLVEITSDPEMTGNLFDITPDLITMAHVILKAVQDTNIFKDFVVPRIPGVDIVLNFVDTPLWKDARTGKDVTVLGIILSGAIVASAVLIFKYVIPMFPKEHLATLLNVALSGGITMISTMSKRKANAKLFQRFTNIDTAIDELSGQLPKGIDYDRLKGKSTFWY